MKTKSVLIAFLIFSACLFSYGCKTVTYDANGAHSGTVPAEAKKYWKGATVTVLGNTGSLAKTGSVFSGSEHCRKRQRNRLCSRRYLQNQK